MVSDNPKTLAKTKSKQQIRDLLLDSGASKHMIGERHLTGPEKRTKRTLENPFIIQTANGPRPVKHEASIWIHSLNKFVWASIMADSPAVRSLGGVAEEGYDFQLCHGQDPILVNCATKRQLPCPATQNVPIIVAGME